MNIDRDPISVAQAELAEEKFREAVEAEKARIKDLKWYEKLFPFTIKIQIKRKGNK